MAIKVIPKDPVKVYGTGKSKFLPKGKVVEVHRIAAEKLVKLGRATYEPQAEEKKKGK